MRWEIQAHGEQHQDVVDISKAPPSSIIIKWLIGKKGQLWPDQVDRVYLAVRAKVTSRISCSKWYSVKDWILHHSSNLQW